MLSTPQSQETSSARGVGYWEPKLGVDSNGIITTRTCVSICLGDMNHWGSPFTEFHSFNNSFWLETVVFNFNSFLKSMGDRTSLAKLWTCIRFISSLAVISFTVPRPGLKTLGWFWIVARNWEALWEGLSPIREYCRSSSSRVLLGTARLFRKGMGLSLQHQEVGHRCSGLCTLGVQWVAFVPWVGVQCMYLGEYWTAWGVCQWSVSGKILLK